MAMSNALSSSLIPSISQAAAVGDRRMMRARTAMAIRFSCIIAIPSTVGLTVLAGPVNNLLFSGDNSVAIQMTIYGSLAVVFYSISTVTNAVLQGIDKMRLPIIHALISLVLHLAALELFFYGFDLCIYSMVYANILFAVFMCILNAVSLKKHLKYRQEIRKTILLPPQPLQSWERQPLEPISSFTGYAAATLFPPSFPFSLPFWYTASC